MGTRAVICWMFRYVTPLLTKIMPRPDAEVYIGPVAAISKLAMKHLGTTGLIGFLLKEG